MAITPILQIRKKLPDGPAKILSHTASSLYKNGWICVQPPKVKPEVKEA